MLRSMIIGIAIAAMLQVGTRTIAPDQHLTFAAQRIDWVQVQTNALGRILCDGYTWLTR